MQRSPADKIIWYSQPYSARYHATNPPSYSCLVVFVQTINAHTSVADGLLESKCLSMFQNWCPFRYCPIFPRSNCQHNTFPHCNYYGNIESNYLLLEPFAHWKCHKNESMSLYVVISHSPPSPSLPANSVYLLHVKKTSYLCHNVDDSRHLILTENTQAVACRF